jgi:hypothetical protein
MGRRDLDKESLAELRALLQRRVWPSWLGLDEVSEKPRRPILVLTTDDRPARVKRRRGRKPTDPKEKNRICARWLKVQDQVVQVDFCNTEGISTSTLREWLQGYPYSEAT